MLRSCLQWTRRTPFHIQRSTLRYQRSSIPSSLVKDTEPDNKPSPWLLSTAAGLTLDPATTTTVTETSLPAVLAANEAILTAIHSTGLPWWATIVAGTLVLRSTLTLPIAIYQQRSMGTMINLAPMITSWAETLKVQVAKESSVAGWPYKKYQAELQKQYRKKVNAIYAHHGCQRWKLLALPWVQIPLFVSMSLTLRHMTAYPLPWYGQTAELTVPGLSEGGLAWFIDLTAVDPTMVIPVLIGAGNLLNVELNAWASRGQRTRMQRVMTNSFRVLSVAFVPIAANAPMSIGLYWFASAWYSVVQNVVFKIPAPQQIKDIKQFLEISRRKDAHSARIKKNADCVKFKVRCSRYLYTLVVKDKSKALKLRQSLPPALAVNEI
ncbi:ribosomal L38e protein family-domain-containing protein [Thamnidium elegans]|uniref:Membrane insertase YidC/Oxa/ALB C-terminal domain-containing protein n=1 Tax=Thamnidium elegans TaxID=101142 RepID=A0A8H7SPK2_9FUNG|nr:hypothetical protein INT48_004801 [Thamnidium elegans]KAI8076988.1 ribosomal L38e protein family-domain-containing protein [Thamnidium elegans]